MESAQAVQRIKKTPHTPGVYVWRTGDGTPLYIGKAADLHTRLAGYPKTAHPRIRAMVRAATKLTWRTTPTDIEALILESRLIKRHLPRFNVDWKDDKRYFSVSFTKEKFPRVSVTHQPLDAELIGPFTEGVSLKTTLRALRRVFPFCTCKTTHHLKCLNAHIGLCPGYCCLKTEPTREEKREYAANIRAVRDILTGRRAALVRRLVRTMPDTALKLVRVFQHARINARLRQGFGGQARNAPRRVEGYDIANIMGQYAVGAMVVFTDGAPDKTSYRLFNIRTAGGDTDMLRELLERRMKHTEWPTPDLVVVDGGKAQLNVAYRAFGNHARVVAVTKNDRHRPDKLIGQGTAGDQALAFVVDAEAHRFAINYYRHRHRKMLV